MKRNHAPRLSGVSGEETPAGKGRPTPKRSEARKARRAPAPGNRKEAAALQRERGREARAKARQALLTGNERDLPPRDAGPERRLARDVVDSRSTVGQFFMPGMLAVVVATIIAGNATKSAAVLGVVNLSGLVVFATVMFDCARCGRLARRAVAEKFSGAEVRGISMYAISRAMLPRRFRRPPPKVARGGALLP